MSELSKTIRRWFPHPVKKSEWEKPLSDFYLHNMQYHTMTASSNKAEHPQVKFLQKLLILDGVYAEVGCGSGLVCRLAAPLVKKIHGFDISPIAIASAKRENSYANAIFSTASAYEIPLADESLDGVWSFEMLEHLWDPAAALREMVRLIKPKGFLLISTPNQLSLDLQLQKSFAARAADFCMAAVRFLFDRQTRSFFINLAPDIMGTVVYPDCDMISSLIPMRIPTLARQVGCTIEILDTYFMCVNKGAVPDQRLARYGAKPFFKWYGDHIFLLLRKN